MFPFIEVWGLKLYFQWVGIILATLVFIYWVYRYSKKVNLRFSLFFSYLSLFIILPYLLGRYFYNVLTYHLFLPADLFFLLSPDNYRFSFIWVSFGFLLALIIFLSKIKYSQERKKWFDVFFYSLALSLVVLWPFLLLGDVFFWKITHSVFWVSALTNFTNIPYPNLKFWPVWIFVSLLGLVLYLLGKILHAVFKKPGITIFLYPLLFLGFWWIFHFQYYQKHFIFGIDVKLLYCILAGSIGFIFFYWLLNFYKKW